MSAYSSTSTVNAVGYVRRSTDKQEASIAEQCREIERYAKEKGYRILRWYTDDGISGDDTRGRSAFLQMIKDATERGDFKAILCWDKARFGRFDSLEYGYYCFPLRQAGIHLATVLNGVVDWSDFTGRVMATVEQEGKHSQLLDHSANVTRGQLGAMKEGGKVGSAPYGYKIEGPRKCKKLVIADEGKVRVVQRIFTEYVAGNSLHSIADRLNKEGYLSPGGSINGWRWNTIKVILENPAYVGDYAGSKYIYGKYHGIQYHPTESGVVVKAEGVSRRKPKEEWIIHRDTHEPVIDRETYAKAQDILAKGKRGRSHHRPESNPYVFSCLLRCGKCGAPLYGNCDRRSGYRYYQCNSYNYKGSEVCEGTTVREEKVLQSISDHLDKEFLSLDGYGLLFTAYKEGVYADELPNAFNKLKAMIAPPPEPEVDRKRIHKELKSLQEKIDKGCRNILLLDSEFVPTAQRELHRLQEEKKLLEKELLRKPHTEMDINTEVKEVLMSLYALAHYFRYAAMGVDEISDDDVDSIATPLLPQISKYLRHISAISIDTHIEGMGRRKRHTFMGGQIYFNLSHNCTGTLKFLASS